MAVWEEIVDYTVPSNTTSVTLNNFGTITKDDFIKIVTTFNGVGYFKLLPNSTTSSNYWRQELIGAGTSIFAGRANQNQFSNIGSTIAYGKISENNRFNILSKSAFGTGSDINNSFFYVTSTVSVSSITSFTIGTNNTIGAGSRIQIYRLNAEKVADITVASNTTQVDITGLNIDKGSEYLLVSDVLANVPMNVQLFPNDLTTSTDYYLQYLRGNGSVADTGRINNNLITNNDTGTRSVAHTHIKLSNIGAFTTQTYGIENVGESGIRVRTWFISSTTESITNITKLNIKSFQSNGIATSSRFQLYKLY